MPQGPSPPSEPYPSHDDLVAELLRQHFHTYPWAMLAASLFALLTAWLIREDLPPAFLLSWLAVFLAFNAYRFRVSRRYDREPPAPGEIAARARFALITLCLGGAAWGMLGAAAITLGAPHRETAMVIFVVFALFATFQASNPANYPPAFNAWVVCAMAPTLAAAFLQPAGVSRSLAPLGTLFVITVLFVGRYTHRFMIDSITKRLENVRLLEDLTAQKNALAEANRGKTRFLAAASHDLRQPMQALVLLVESLRERVRQPGNIRIAESIRTSVDAMSALLNEILDISRFDAGTVSPQRSSFTVSTVLDRLRSAFSYPAAQRNLSFRVRGCKAVVDSDPILLYRILVNLTHNALRYTREGGILVGCRRRREGVLIEVWDSGVGIPADQFEAIFREFHQLQNPQRDREKGFGLGLAIVERTARLLEHPLRVRSRVGRGSVFSILVPYGDPARVGAAESPRPAEILEGCRVLVVEDDREIRQATILLLEGWRCEVHAAASGAELDRLLATLAAPPDAILADYRLPGGENGIQIIARLRDRYPGAGAILVSGDIAPEVHREAQAAGLPFLHKPLRPARLRALLGALWRSRQRAPARAAASEAAEERA